MKRPMLWSLAGLPLGLLAYLAVNWASAGREVHRFDTWLDSAIPLQPGWVLVYGSIDFLMAVAIVAIRDIELLKRAAKAYLTVFFVSVIFFVAWPTMAPRPASLPGTDFWSWALGVVYRIDAPYNCFPSLHVSEALVTAVLCWQVHQGVGLAVFLLTGLISISTLFTKQHYIADVLAAAVLGPCVTKYFLRGYRPGSAHDADHRNTPRRAVWVALAYAALVAGFALAYAL